MFKKIQITFFLSLFIFLFILTLKFYFSEKNIKFTNKSRNFYELELYNLKVPLLNTALFADCATKSNCPCSAFCLSSSFAFN